MLTRKNHSNSGTHKMLSYYVTLYCTSALFILNSIVHKRNLNSRIHQTATEEKATQTSSQKTQAC